MDRTEGGYAESEGAGFCLRSEREDWSGDSGENCPEERKAGDDPPHHDGGQVASETAERRWSAMSRQDASDL